jgi:glucan phosphoethanolaminetransferase (alkaline phosphatase superfamily)
VKLQTNKLLSSLCYFSVFFAPFLFPIIVYFIADEHEVKQHAKKSLLSHIIPVITIIVPFFLFLFAGMFGSPEAFAFGVVIFGFILVGIVNVVVFIYNIVMGIKILKTV